jgi:hypothetical protein
VSSQIFLRISAKKYLISPAVPLFGPLRGSCFQGPLPPVFPLSFALGAFGIKAALLVQNGWF